MASRRRRALRRRPPTTAADAALASTLRIGVMRLARRLRVERSGDDLTLNQLAVLGTLRRYGALSVGELAGHENVKPPSMTRTVACLEEIGLVTRRPHATDGRQVVVDLTAAGPSRHRRRPRAAATPGSPSASPRSTRRARAAPRASPRCSTGSPRHEVRRSTRRFAALKFRNYRLFAGGSFLSNIGTWLQRVAQDWLVLALTGSAGALGITTGLQFLPTLLFSPFAGVIADRYPKKPGPQLDPGDHGRHRGADGRARRHRRRSSLARLRPDVRVRDRPRALDIPARQAFVNEMVDRRPPGQRRRPQLGVVQPRPDDRPGARRRAHRPDGLGRRGHRLGDPAQRHQLRRRRHLADPDARQRAAADEAARPGRKGSSATASATSGRARTSC